ncbi:MBL fold metallo-hydrolase [Synechocystis sp. LKSZ1]|uniref:MBL fold metallo-hydrolase n=1 Tax=Synechocystis sp. LKSZ1 TaxID=3144951 RepID=UPI00336BC2E1
MQLTWFDSNSWLIEMAGQTILLDPWLVGSLTFGNLPWLFKGEKTTQYDLPAPIDLLLLSQGLEDHAHPPTLASLDHHLPVVGSPNAARVVTGLGYDQVTALQPGESLTLKGRLEIRALPGSLVGPNLIENAYLLTDKETGHRLYYEPHGFHAAELQAMGPVDVVLTPVVGIRLLGLAPVLKGQETTLELCRWLQPQVLLPTSGAAAITYEGLLAKVLRLEGSVERFQQLLQANHLTTEVLLPQPGVPLALALDVPARTAMATQ